MRSVVAISTAGGSSGSSLGPMMTWYLLSPPRIMNRMPGMLVASTTLFSSAVSAPERLPSATRWMSLGFMPASSAASTAVISPKDFGLEIANFLPFRSAMVLIGEFGITMMTLLAIDREPISTILMSWPSLMAAMMPAGEVSP